MTRLSRLVILAAGALFAAACSDSQSPPTATTIVLSASTVTFDAIGATQTITATVNDQRGNPMPNAIIAWKSSTAAATVVPAAGSSSTSSATVTSMLNGPATITATAGSASATIDVITTQVPSQIQKFAGDVQVGTVNLPLLQSLSVRVLDRLGAAVAGVPVAFAVTQGGGGVAQSSVSTGGDGIASTSWTLGKITSQSQQVTATAGALPGVTFSAIATPGAPAKLTVVAGDKQTGSVGSSLAQVPQVVVSDAFDNAVPNTVVTFVATGGTVQFPQTQANSIGVATPGNWTLGTTPGTKTLVASANGAQSATISATAVVGPPAKMSVTGSNQVANAGSAVAVPPSVRILDAFSNPISGVSVTFAVATGGGSVTGPTQTTDANGVATLGSWTLGTANGTNTLSVTTPASLILTATITATATNGTGPALSGSINITNGANQAAMAGTAVPLAPTVTLRDASGNPLAGVPVTFTVTSGGGSVTGAVTTTNASGVASLGSWVLGSTAALNTMTANATGFPSVTFNGAGCEGGGGSGYAITICYRTSMTASQKQTFVDAAARWRSIITSDLLDLPVSIGEGQCDTGTPSVNMTVDDLLIFAAVQPIDGANGILGSAGWCFRRNNGLPLIGTMMFDAADVAALESSNRFSSVILHEMGHVIGIGTMWTEKNLLQNPSSTSALDTYFSGASGIAGFNAIGGSTYTGGQKVPVENTGGIGTINSHWRESVLGNELMTGYLNSGTNPLSILSVRSLEDIGYTVNTAAADPFSLTLSLRANVFGIEDPGVIALKNDVFTGRQWTIDNRGRMTRIR